MQEVSYQPEKLVADQSGAGPRDDHHDKPHKTGSVLLGHCALLSPTRTILPALRQQSKLRLAALYMVCAPHQQRFFERGLPPFTPNRTECPLPSLLAR
jgi:hypothetical protein